MNEAVMVRYDSRESSLQRGKNFARACPYIDFCEIPMRYSQRDAGRFSLKDIEDHYEEVCSSQGGSSCLTHEMFDEALQKAISTEGGAGYDFNLSTHVMGLPQVRLESGFKPGEVYALVVKDEPSRSRLVKNGSSLWSIRDELIENGLANNIVEVKGPIKLENLGEKNGT